MQQHELFGLVITGKELYQAFRGDDTRVRAWDRLTPSVEERWHDLAEIVNEWHFDGVLPGRHRHPPVPASRWLRLKRWFGLGW